MKKRSIALVIACTVIFTTVFSPNLSGYADILDDENSSVDTSEDYTSVDYDLDEPVFFTKEGREIIYLKENLREQGGFYEMCGDWLYYVDPEEYALFAINVETEETVQLTDYPVANLNVYDNTLYFTDLSESLMGIRLDPSALTDVTLGGKLYKLEKADSPSEDSEPVDISEEGKVYYYLVFDEDGFFCLEGDEGLMGKDLEYSKLNKDGEQIGALSLAPEDEIVKSYEQDGYVYLEVDHIDPESGDNAGYILRFDRDNGTGSREYIFGEDLHAYNGDIYFICTLDSYLYRIPDGYSEARRISVTPVSKYSIVDGTLMVISSVGNVAIVISEEEDIDPFAIFITVPAGEMINYIEPVTRSDKIFEKAQKDADEALEKIAEEEEQKEKEKRRRGGLVEATPFPGPDRKWLEEWLEEWDRKQRAEREAREAKEAAAREAEAGKNALPPIDNGGGTTPDDSTSPEDYGETPIEDYDDYRRRLAENKGEEAEKERESVPDIRPALEDARQRLAREEYGEPLPSADKGWNKFDEGKAKDYQAAKEKEAAELAEKPGTEEGYVNLLDPRLYEFVNKKNNTGSGSTASDSYNSTDEDSNSDKDSNVSGIDPCKAVEIILSDILSETKSGIPGKYYSGEQLSAYYSAYGDVYENADYGLDFRNYDNIGLDSMLKGVGFSDSEVNQLWDRVNTNVKNGFASCRFTTSLVEISPDGSRALVRVNASNYLDVSDMSGNDLFEEWKASVGYKGSAVYSYDSKNVRSYMDYALDHIFYNNPGTKAFDVMVYSDPVLGWVCDTSEDVGKSAYQIILVSESGTYSGSLSGSRSDGNSSGNSESGGAPSGSSAAGGAANDSNTRHYDPTQPTDASKRNDNMTEFFKQVELEKDNGDKASGYMSIPFSRPNTLKITVLDRKVTDQKNALDSFLNSIFGFRPDTYRDYSDTHPGIDVPENTTRVVLDNSLPGERPVEIMVTKNVVLEQKPRPISDTLSDIKDSFIDAAKNAYEAIYEKVTGTPINKEVYDPNLHFPPSYEDGVQQPLVELPREILDKRQEGKIKALEEQMRKDYQKYNEKKANEEKMKAENGGVLIDVSEYFKQPG